jgi:hypothetical protein
MNRNRRVKQIGGVVIYLSLFACNAHVESARQESRSMQFSYTTNGAAEGGMNIYGNNEVSVSGDVLTVEVGDSDGDRNVSGVGIYELKLLNQNLEAAKSLAELLCSPEDLKSDVTIPDLYIVKCDGKMKSSFVKDFNRDIVRRIRVLVNRLKVAGVQDGRKLVKLDLSLASIDRERDGFLVTFRFLNGGDYPIKFKTPDRWNAKKDRGMDILSVNGYRVGGSGADDDQLALALAGKVLVDPSKVTGGEINLVPHSSVILKIKSNSIKKFSAGTYDLNIGAFMNIEVVGLRSNLLRVDFHSDYKKPARITFDRDYPATPEEREQWEADHKARMSFHPVKPGETFAEDGLYRAVRMSGDGAIRSLQLTAFKAGDIATTDSVKMFTESASGTELNGRVQWVWAGSAPTPVKQWSPDMIDGTQHRCKAGEVCPRSGRWLARMHSGDWKYQYDLAGIVTLKRGERMPGVTDDGRHGGWEWLGV